MNKMSLGAIHSLIINQNPHIIRGEVIAVSRDLFLCYAKSEDMYYYVSEDGLIQVFSDEKLDAKVSINGANCHLKIDVTKGELFIFSKKPIESLKHLLLFDAYLDHKFMVNRESKKVIPYDLSIDKELRLLYAELE